MPRPRRIRTTWNKLGIPASRQRMPMTSRSRGVRAAAALLVIASCPGHAATAFAQTATPPRREGPVVRVTTGLVQIDAVVTDGQGKHVTDLGPGDFVVREGGQLRQ